MKETLNTYSHMFTDARKKLSIELIIRMKKARKLAFLLAIFIILHLFLNEKTVEPICQQPETIEYNLSFYLYQYETFSIPFIFVI